jgi:hypothetical protein
MLIVAREQVQARLQFFTCPSLQLEIPFEVTYSLDFGASNRAAWHQEYLENVAVLEDGAGRDFSACATEASPAMARARLNQGVGDPPWDAPF